MIYVLNIITGYYDTLWRDAIGFYFILCASFFVVHDSPMTTVCGHIWYSSSLIAVFQKVLKL